MVNEAYLLCVSAISYRLVLIILKYYMPQLWVWNIFNDMPLHWETAIPLVLLPEIHGFIEINTANHLCNSTELAACIYLKQPIQFKKALAHYQVENKGARQIAPETQVTITMISRSIPRRKEKRDSCCLSLLSFVVHLDMHYPVSYFHLEYWPTHCI